MALLERLLPKGIVVGRTNFELLLLLVTSGAEAFLVFLPERPGDPLVGGMSSLLTDILRGATRGISGEGTGEVPVDAWSRS
jgi:hypothetical protein